MENIIAMARRMRVLQAEINEAQLTSAYEQGQRDAVPEGFVLVPKEQK